MRGIINSFLFGGGLAQNRFNIFIVKINHNMISYLTED
jgi:hypothetical protein